MNIKKNTSILLGYCFLAVLLFFLFFYCGITNKNTKIKSSKKIDDFYSKGIVRNSLIDRFIEDDYFKKNTLYNGDFSQGLSHWATTGITENFVQESKNRLELIQEKCFSDPYSLKVVAMEYPCRIFYSKNKNESFIRNPWNFLKSSAWMGMPGKKEIIISFYYKGYGPTIILNIMPPNSSKDLVSKVFQESTSWNKGEIRCITPADCRAILLQIQVTSLVPEATLFLDDITLEVK